jgi:nudix motif 8
MTGVAVTPVVGWLGELNELNLTPNPDEVESFFTVPFKDLLNERHWATRDDMSPVFTGGPYVIWGLTSYLLRRFCRDVVAQTHLIKPSGQEGTVGLKPELMGLEVN